MSALDYKLNVDLDDKARSFVMSSIERSYHTSSVEISGDTLTATFEEEVSPEGFGELMTRLLYISRSINADVLYENEVQHAYGENPMPHLLAGGDVIKIGTGLFLFQGVFWKVFQGLHEYVKDLARKYDAVEQEYPALWPVDLFKKIDYFKEFPQQAILATTVQNSFEARAQFAERYAKDQDYQTVATDELLADCTYGLQPAVCDVCYYALRHARDHQNRVYTTYNKVFRNEVSKTDSLDRLPAFSVRDIMFVGDEAFVLEVRERLIEDLSEFLAKLNLNSRIETANDPFFTNDSAMKNVFQNASRSKYELLARLNHSGEYIAVGSINLHLDFFGKAFDIGLPDGGPVHSGCIGIGFERLAYALYCQYGHQVESWPTELKELLGLGSHPVDCGSG